MLADPATWPSLRSDPEAPAPKLALAAIGMSKLNPAFRPKVAPVGTLDPPVSMPSTDTGTTELPVFVWVKAPTGAYARMSPCAVVPSVIASESPA